MALIFSKGLLFTLGIISFILAIIGALLPVLPTTPFLILSAYCFARSYPPFHQKLLDLPYFGKELKKWEENRVIRPQVKWTAVIMLNVSIIVSALLFVQFMYAKVVMLIIGILVSIYIFRQKSH